MTYWRLHYHIIWSTQDRQPSLTSGIEKVFYKVIYAKAKELDLKIHAAGNVDDHAHIVLSIPPKITVADSVRHFKGASAHAINHMEGSDGHFKWQAGYGALTVSESLLETVAKMQQDKRNIINAGRFWMFMRKSMKRNEKNPRHLTAAG